MLLLERFAYSPLGTFGKFHADDFWCFTVEQPWNHNQAGHSCIPEGIYTLKQRRSAVVLKTTRGAYTLGWEVTNVPDRTFIMLHPGNTMDDVEGCIAVGDQLGWVNAKWAVLNSRNTFSRLMDALGEPDSIQLRIQFLEL